MWVPAPPQDGLVNQATTASAADPVADRPRSRRRRGRLGLAVLATMALVAAAVALVANLGTSPSHPSSSSWTLDLAWGDGLVVTTGSGFEASSTVDVSARFDGGSGSALMTTDEAGRFSVAFRPPVGVTGDVEVTAAAGDAHTDRTVAMTPAAAAGPAPAPGDLLVVPTTGAPAAPTAAPDSGLPRFEVPADIAADCSADVATELNAWLSTVPDDSEVRFAPGACYRVEDSLTLEDRNGLVIEGNGATFRAETPVPTPETNRAQWRLDYGTGIVLRDMTLVGVNREPRFDQRNEFDHNLFIRGSWDVTVDNVHGRGAYGDYIAIAQGTDGTSIPGDITIRNSSAETVGRMGISCVACDGVTVENSVFNDIGYHAFDLEVEDDGWPTRGVRYTGNTVGRHGHAFFSVGTPFRTDDNDVSDIQITGNLVTQPGANNGDCVPAISFLYNKVPVRDVRIEDNDLVSRTDAIVVKLASDVVVRNNTARLVAPTCGDPVGIRAPSTDGADVSANELTGYE